MQLLTHASVEMKSKTIKYLPSIGRTEENELGALSLIHCIHCSLRGSLHLGRGEQASRNRSCRLGDLCFTVRSSRKKDGFIVKVCRLVLDVELFIVTLDSHRRKRLNIPLAFPPRENLLLLLFTDWLASFWHTSNMWHHLLA